MSRWKKTPRRLNFPCFQHPPPRFSMETPMFFSVGRGERERPFLWDLPGFPAIQPTARSASPAAPSSLSTARLASPLSARCREALANPLSSPCESTVSLCPPPAPAFFARLLRPFVPLRACCVSPADPTACAPDPCGPLCGLRLSCGSPPASIPGFFAFLGIFLDSEGTCDILSKLL